MGAHQYTRLEDGGQRLTSTKRRIKTTCSPSSWARTNSQRLTSTKEGLRQDGYPPVGQLDHSQRLTSTKRRIKTLAALPPGRALTVRD